jgi:hypothetical protein
MIGEDSIKIFYERADCILKYRNKVLAEIDKTDRNKIKMEMRYNKLQAKSRELEEQYKVLIEAIGLIKPLFQKKH